MKKIAKASLKALLALLVLAGAIGFAQFRKTGKFDAVFQKGMCYTTWSKGAYALPRSDKSLKKIKGINVEWVTILATWYQDNCYSTSIFPTQKTPSDKSLKHAIDEAKSLGMKVMVKPHLDILSTEYGSWRGEIAPVSESGWNEWFDEYKKFILHYAEIARDTKADMFCIGTELSAATAGHTEKWREIIREIRKAYKGPLVYAANWDEEYLHIRFWDDLDYAGIDAYFPLTTNNDPTKEELIAAWEKTADSIEEWLVKNNIERPVIFTELGYVSSDGTNKQPWATLSNPEDQKEQADCLEATFEVLTKRAWFKGIYLWQYFPQERWSPLGFTIKDKESEEVVKKWYKKGGML